MGLYADQIARLALVKRIRANASDDHVSKTDADLLHAMVLHAADEAGDALVQIPVTFQQYTKHDLLHARNLIVHMGNFIPARTLKILNPLELSVLVLSAMLHDLGMYVTAQERDGYVDSEEFRSFVAASPERQQAMEEVRNAGRPSAARAIEDAALAEYFRKLHPERARQNIDLLLKGKLRFGQVDLSHWVADICESHGWGVLTSSDPAHPDRCVAALEPEQLVYNVPIHPQYIACCLRIADILDFDQSRTPVSLLRTITDPISQREWQKHLQIHGAKITEHAVEFFARCMHPEHYLAVMEYMDWIDAELVACRRLVTRNAPPDVARTHQLHLPAAVDRFHIVMDDPAYVAGAFRFELDYERIMKLLMDKSLYPDPSLFLRELLQNALDACRLKKALAEWQGAAYEPSIVVWDHSDDGADPRIVFQDNGIGMSEEVVKNYFMRVGRSYYRSKDFNTQRQKLEKRGITVEATSQFGIGVLSCFMAGDRMEIETYRVGDHPLHITVEGPTKYFVMKRLPLPPRQPFAPASVPPEKDGPPEYSGTRLTMHLRPGAKADVEQVLEQFAVNVDVPVTVHGRTETKAIPAWGWSPDRERALMRLPEALRGILVPVFVPLHEYEFARHLRGSAWFWFLRGEGGGITSERGYLRVGDYLSCSGIPRAAAASVHYRSLRDKEELRQGMKSMLDNELQQYVSSLSDNELERFLEWAGEVYETKKRWHETLGAPEALIAGGDAWLSVPADYSDMAGLGRHRDALSLHGIRVPAGITSWNPLAGYGRQLEFINFAVGYEIDARGWDAPVPAASRLFFDPEQGAKVAVPLLRALVRYAFELDGHSLTPSRWRDELASAVAGSPYWPEVLEADAQMLLGVVPFVIEGGGLEIRRLDLAGIRRMCGRHVRLGLRWFLNKDEQPFVYDMGMGDVLLFTHAVERDERGWVVDLDHPVERTAAEFRELIRR